MIISQEKGGCETLQLKFRETQYLKVINSCFTFREIFFWFREIKGKFAKREINMKKYEDEQFCSHSNQDHCGRGKIRTPVAANVLR